MILVYWCRRKSNLRDRRLIAYFRQFLANDLNIDTIRELANALASHPRYQISVSSIQIKHLHCRVPCTAEVLYSANASVVGLAVSSKEDNCLPICVGLSMHFSKTNLLARFLFVIILIRFLEF